MSDNGASINKIERRVRVVMQSVVTISLIMFMALVLIRIYVGYSVQSRVVHLEDRIKVLEEKVALIGKQQDERLQSVERIVYSTLGQRNDDKDIEARLKVLEERIKHP